MPPHPSRKGCLRGRWSTGYSSNKRGTVCTPFLPFRSLPFPPPSVAACSTRYTTHDTGTVLGLGGGGRQKDRKTDRHKKRQTATRTSSSTPPTLLTLHKPEGNVLELNLLRCETRTPRHLEHLQIRRGKEKKKRAPLYCRLLFLSHSAYFLFFCGTKNVLIIEGRLRSLGSTVYATFPCLCSFYAFFTSITHLVYAAYTHTC